LSIDTYLEIGKTRVFAAALEWPGWCRAGHDEESALQALVDYGRRYARVLNGTRLGFEPPHAVSALNVVERLAGDASTDFGAPGAVPKGDAAAVDARDLKRLESVLRACWRTFDAALETAHGKQLRKGPRGGGRDVSKIVEHVLGADGGYLSRLAWKVEPGPQDEAAQLARTRAALVDALAAAARGDVPETGPRGGKRWTPRYFVRRVAWHVLDHAWEIEDRIE
jgi:DinB superfamily